MTESPTERTLRARIAAHVRWANEPDRQAATAKARQALADRWEKQVDPEGKLPPHIRAKLAENAKSAHYSRMALKSAQARRRKKAA